jgi:hypothetical protein
MREEQMGSKTAGQGVAEVEEPVAEENLTFGEWWKSLGASARAERAQREREAEQARLLPPDLAAQIVQLCDNERDWLLTRIAAIDDELTVLDARIAETRAASTAAAHVVAQPPDRRETWDGRVAEVPKPALVIRGEASIAAGYGLGPMFTYRRALEEERAGRQGQLHEVAIVKRNAQEGGAVAAVLSIVRGWHTRLEIGTNFLAPAAKAMGTPADSRGNPLSEAEVADLRLLEEHRGGPR